MFTRLCLLIYTCSPGHNRPFLIYLRLFAAISSGRFLLALCYRLLRASVLGWCVHRYPGTNRLGGGDTKRRAIEYHRFPKVPSRVEPRGYSLDGIYDLWQPLVAAGISQFEGRDLLHQLGEKRQVFGGQSQPGQNPTYLQVFMQLKQSIALLQGVRVVSFCLLADLFLCMNTIPCKGGKAIPVLWE